MVLEAISRSGRLSLGDKLYEINWGFVLLLTAIASVGFAMLYSAADGNFDPWASRQMVRFAMGMVLLMVFAVIDPRVWMQLAYPAYGFALLLLIGVEVAGNGVGSTLYILRIVVEVELGHVFKPLHGRVSRKAIKECADTLGDGSAFRMNDSKGLVQAVGIVSRVIGKPAFPTCIVPFVVIFRDGSPIRLVVVAADWHQDAFCPFRACGGDDLSSSRFSRPRNFHET